jgi:hypothetical protein
LAYDSGKKIAPTVQYKKISSSSTDPIIAILWRRKRSQTSRPGERAGLANLPKFSISSGAALAVAVAIFFLS